MKTRTVLIVVFALMLTVLNPTAEGLDFMSSQVTGQAQEYISAEIKSWDAGQDERQSGWPEEVRDSLGQWIPDMLSLFLPDLPENQIQEERDPEGRVVHIVWILDDQLSRDYTYSYDDQGRFSAFCYRAVHKNWSLSHGITTRYQGEFTYHEDGSRECVEIIQSEDIWICGTFYYDSDGKWIRMEGRNLYPGLGIGEPIDVRASYYEGKFGGESLYIDGVDEMVQTFYFNWGPHTPATE